MKNEAEKFLDVLNSTGSIQVNNGIDNENVLRFFSSCVINPFDRPDIYLENSSEIWLIEHFEVDATRTIKGSGTIGRSSEAIRLQEFNVKSIESGILANNGYHSSTLITTENNLENYINNLERLIVKHYSKIDSYYENFLDKVGNPNNKKIKMCFFIEDVSPIGSYIETSEDLEPLQIVRIKHIFDLLKASTRLHYIFFSNYFMSDYIMFMSEVQTLNSSEIDFYIDGTDHFKSSNPMESHFVVGVNSKDI